MNITWHSKTTEEVLQALRSTPQGLSSSEAHKRIAEKGPNTLPSEKIASWVKILFQQFKSPLIYLLLFASGVTIWLREWTDTTVILLSVAVNTGIGFYQEFHSGNIFESLRRSVKSTALVFRDNDIKEIDAIEITIGDILLLKIGAKIPADARLLRAQNLETNESLLTGESTPVKKYTDPVSPETALADRRNMVFMGTTIEKGEGRAVVTGIGIDTEIGKIAQLTKDVKDEKTPLQKRISKLGKILVIISTLSIALIFILGVFQGREISELLVTAVAVAVAAIPEGLPAALSVVLAVAAQRIFKKKGLIRKLIAAETLGSTSVICTDKTGTLTEGVMKVNKLQLIDNTESTRETALLSLGLANEAVIEHSPQGILIKGDSTDQAKLGFFLEQEKDVDTMLAKFPRQAFLPFDEYRKYIASFHNDNNGDTLILVNGAPEVLIEASTATNKEQLYKDNETLAGQGFRVLGIAVIKKPISKNEINEANNNPEKLRNHITGLTFLGFAAIRDPIRADVYSTVQKTRGAGVNIIMLTGDHKFTACAIGKELGFTTTNESVITGTELDTLSSEDLIGRIHEFQIFARVTPAHKLRIVQAWQAKGEAVTMTGDGVNDTPSLKAADIGVALGSGTEIAKDASDLVLVDNSFSIITDAIEQGRIAFDNIRKVVIFLLNGTFTEILIILGALIFNLPIPLTAVQILWINLVEDGLPNFALAFEPGEEDVMQRKPLKKEEPIINKPAASIIFIAGLIGDAFLIGLYLFLSKETTYSLIEIQTIFFAAIGTDALFNIFALKSLKKPLYRMNFLSNKYLFFAVLISFVVMLASIYLPILNNFLGVTPLGLGSIGIVISYIALRTGLIETVKWWYYSKDKPAISSALSQ